MEKLYPLFLVMAAATIFSPGPGVVMTLTNSMRYGFHGTFGGIVGIASGTLVVASISATGMGVILATSVLAFTVLKYIGAAYLIYLGIKLWRAPALSLDSQSVHYASFKRRFIEGLSLQVTNPNAIFFFLSIFPQFIDPAARYEIQFAILVFTYGVLVIIIHSLYAICAQRLRSRFASNRGGRMINRAGGAVLVFFGLALATAKR